MGLEDASCGNLAIKRVCWRQRRCSLNSGSQPFAARELDRPWRFALSEIEQPKTFKI